MRFEFYSSEIENVPKLSVDGTVDNSIHFSHWQGNQTPAELKADTSTEIGLNLVASPKKLEFTQGIELVTNNHFDTDGVLSCWTVLTGERALKFRETLIAAAEAGDFSEFTNEDGIKVSIAIQGADQASPSNDDVSPLAQQLAGTSDLDDARCYELVLPEVEKLLTRPSDYESLWRGGWDQIIKANESFQRGKSTVEEFADAKLSLIILSPEIFSPTGFNPTRHSAPFTAISRFARGQIYLIAAPINGGWTYRIDYPYYSWAETVVRPRIARQDLGPLLVQLNQLEPLTSGEWKLDNRELTSAVKFLGSDGVLGTSGLSPDVVAQSLRAQLLGSPLSLSNTTF
jgi:Family of unknown function (DUF6687)